MAIKMIPMTDALEVKIKDKLDALRQLVKSPEGETLLGTRWPDGAPVLPVHTYDAHGQSRWAYERLTALRAAFPDQKWVLDKVWQTQTGLWAKAGRSRTAIVTLRGLITILLEHGLSSLSDREILERLEASGIRSGRPVPSAPDDDPA